jgi:hypothetical protein
MVTFRLGGTGFGAWWNIWMNTGATAAGLESMGCGPSSCCRKNVAVSLAKPDELPPLSLTFAASSTF